MREVTITVDDAAGLIVGYGPAAVGRVQWSATQTGVFADIATPTFALVPGTSAYTVWDAAGTATTWYRSRYESAGGGLLSDWSDASQGIAAYATLDELKASYPTAPIGSDGRFLDLLQEGAAELDAAIGWDFYPHASATWVVEVTTTNARYNNRVLRQGGQLCVHSGITSLTLVRVSWDAGTTWTSLSAGDWLLIPRIPLPGEPYDHVQLNPYSSTVGAWWVPGWWVEFTGVRGYAAVPTRIRNANIALARQMGGGDMTIPGGGQIMDDIAGGGLVVNTGRWPEIAYRAKRYYGDKFMCWR